MGYPGAPTLAVLSIGGPSDTLVRHWQDAAIVSEWNFCAIEVGEEAASDTELPELLRAHVPEGTHLYLAQRDAKVSIGEIEDVREVLDRLEICLASDEALNADDVRSWNLPLLDELVPSGHVGSDDEDIAAVKQRLAENEATSLELRAEIGQLHAIILAMRNAGADPGEGEHTQPTFVNDFNELQFSKHWQSVAGTPGARAVQKTITEIYYLDEPTQSHVEGLLHTLLPGMRDDPGALRSVLNAAEKQTTGKNCLFALSKMCIAYMEHRVASGGLDDTPLLALDYARCVQRHKLLEDAYASTLETVRASEGRTSALEIEVSLAFEDALIAVLRDGGKRGVSLHKGVMTQGQAVAADTVQAAWQDMLQRGNAGFQDFLAHWTPWQTWVSRRQARLAAERKSQHPMN
ncbi:hypothetical protein H4CHR_05850 [Variovorax sp. PBS-H4]|nr:hypothetical protein H4CHR_05850 [Variovorax sp. PBS-H4]